MRGDRQNHTRSPCRPVTHLLSHDRTNFRNQKIIPEIKRTNFENQKIIREIKRTRQESKHYFSYYLLLLEHRSKTSNGQEILKLHVKPLLRGNSDALNQSNLRNFSAYIINMVIQCNPGNSNSDNSNSPANSNWVSVPFDLTQLFSHFCSVNSKSDKSKTPLTRTKFRFRDQNLPR